MEFSVATKKLIAMTAPVTIEATEADGTPKTPTFSVVAYTGGAMNLNGWDMPVVVDLAGMTFGNSLVANLDHETSKRVGHVTGKDKSGGKLVLSGLASAANPARDEVVNSAATGFVWQASIEAMPQKVIEVEAGKTVTVNGQEMTGPLYVARKSVLKGFAFVSHGADDNTTVSIAARAASEKEPKMNEKCREWIEAMGFDVDSLTADQVKNLEADFAGKSGKRTIAAAKPGSKLDEIKAEQKRKADLEDIAAKFAEQHPHVADAIGELYAAAIESKQSAKDFRSDCLEAMLPQSHTTFAPRQDRNNGVTSKVLEAAIAKHGRLYGDDDKLVASYGEQTLDAADKHFRHGIGLKQLFVMAAQANGYRGHGFDVTPEVHNYAFGMGAGPHIRASGGFSTLDITTILSNTANKFLRTGWDAVDMTPMRISAIRSVRDFKTITTASLVTDVAFQELGPAGEIRHGSASEVTYSNRADTYARMLAITRRDIINDDLGALTEVPRKLGRGGALKLNELFWTEFLDNSTFFTSGNINVSTADGTLGLTGLNQADTIFMEQTDPNGDPLGIMPAILLVPTALKTTALQLMNSERLKGDLDEGDANVWRGRFRVESSPYMSNTSYTGYSAVAWYLLADPSVMPVIEIAALNGNVMPTVETADAAFNVLGVQMRGYSDVGVALQEYRGGVRADGSGA